MVKDLGGKKSGHSPVLEFAVATLTPANTFHKRINMQILQIINQIGPLPLKGQFKSPMDGPALLVVTGSLWSQSVNTLLTVDVQLDGTSIGTAKIWSNGVATHRAFPTLFLPVNLTYAQHVLTLTPGANVVSDLNDTFTAYLIF